MPVAAFTLRITSFAESAMNRLPPLSRVIPLGYERVASVARRSSPEYPFPPVPAIVVMLPEMALTFRIRFPYTSEKNKFPCASSTKSYGVSSLAFTAGMFSNSEPPDVDPTTVVMMPVIASTLRIRSPVLSTMYWFPEVSRATHVGLLRYADSAGMPSSLMYAVGDPATVLMRYGESSSMALVREVSSSQLVTKYCRPCIFLSVFLEI